VKILTRMLVASLAVGVVLPEAADGAQGAEAVAGEGLETRIWLDRGVDPVFQVGDEARVYYRASVDAYLVLLHMSTDGILRLLFPGAPDQAQLALGGRDYRLIFPGSDSWIVEESPGVGYFFVIASKDVPRFDRLNEVQIAGGWASSPGRNRVSQDPYQTVDEFARALLPGIRDGDYAIDFTAYHIGQAYSYPRFLCYQCHTAPAFEEWNPYQQTCPDVRVVIYNDPYYYPATRYQGDRVVYPTPPEPGLPQFAFVRRNPGEIGTPIVRSRAAIRDVLPASPFAGVGGGDAPDVEFLRRVGQGSPAAVGPNGAGARGPFPPAATSAPIRSLAPGGDADTRPILRPRSPSDSSSSR
jgi:hypothetical protein